MKKIVALTALMIGVAMPAMAMDSDMQYQVEKHFRIMDADNNGMITIGENEAGTRNMFRDADSDNDGFITKDEMVSAKLREMPNINENQKAMCEQFFFKADADGNGKLNSAEYASVSEQMFNDADVNNSGTVTLNEMLDLVDRQMSGMYNNRR